MTNGWTDTEEIERELDDTRSRLDATIGALQQKLAPGTMVDQAVEYFTEGGGVELGRNLGRSLRDNPIPVALIGVGIGWLVWSNSTSNGRSDDADWQDRGWPRDRVGLGANRDPYGRRSHRYGGGFDQEVSRHQPMPYEAAAYDDLASKANRAAAAVKRNADEAEDAFQGRVEAARASVLGLTRNAGEAMEGFRARVEEALGSAADSARSLAASAGDSASRLADRGREAVQGFYEQGASALHGVRDRAGDAAGQVRHFSSRTIDYVQEQPLLLGALGITVGAAIGMLLPSSRYERRMAASLRDSLGESARQVVGEAGQSVARVAESVLDTAQEATRREGFVDTEGRDLAAVARDKVADVAGRARHVVEETAAAGREAVRRELAGEGNGDHAGIAPQRPAKDPSQAGVPVVASASPAPDQDRPDVLGPGEAARPEERRAAAVELGHEARTSRRIPPKGWGQVLKRVWSEATSDQILMVAASCAFYATLALFPAISVLISLYGLLFDPRPIEPQLAAVSDVLPAAVFELVAQRLHDLVTRPSAALSWGLAIGVLTALWSASAGTKALIYALNVAYEEQEKRGLIRFNLTALSLHPVRRCRRGDFAGAHRRPATAASARDAWAARPRLPPRVMSYALLLACVVLGLALLYRFAPSRREAHWHWITPGSVLAACSGSLASILFSLYVSNFASYDATYGSLGAVASR